MKKRFKSSKGLPMD